MKRLAIVFVIVLSALGADSDQVPPLNQDAPEAVKRYWFFTHLDQEKQYLKSHLLSAQGGTVDASISETVIPSSPAKPWKFPSREEEKKVVADLLSTLDDCQNAKAPGMSPFSNPY